MNQFPEKLVEKIGNDGVAYLEDCECRVEMRILGPPSWSPLMRIRIHMSHAPYECITVWKFFMFNFCMNKIFGTYTPPQWFLKLIGQDE